MEVVDMKKGKFKVTRVKKSSDSDSFEVFRSAGEALIGPFVAQEQITVVKPIPKRTKNIAGYYGAASRYARQYT
jgi:hypothetical protein